MDIEAKLAELAEEHLAQMAKVSWDAYAGAIRKREPISAGETFGCEIDGIYFDIGDRAEWTGERDGDIRLTAFACTDPGLKENERCVERSALIKKPA